MEYPCILIPAYKPDEKLISLIRQLLAMNMTNLVVVDDGGGETFAPLFAQARALGCKVVRHVVNMGKGRALKTGLNYCLEHDLAGLGVITADADGQHTPADIARIAEAMAARPEALVLGVREFTGKVPLRSQLGNKITRLIFASINGEDIRDTQTGLRGLPLKWLPLFLSLAGERYEFEMNMLLAIRPNEIPVEQVPIETIYLDDNKASHYNPLIDSLRIYKLFLKFIISSLVAAGLDFFFFFLMTLLVPGQVLASVIVARIGSSFINYNMNRHLVFKRKSSSLHSLGRYYALAVVIMLGSYGLIKLFHGVLGINLYVAKLMGDVLLYAVSFIIQREFVYHK
jgi:glycosyltransferase involved in cell wall biosynthesis